MGRSCRLASMRLRQAGLAERPDLRSPRASWQLPDVTARGLMPCMRAVRKMRPRTGLASDRMRSAVLATAVGLALACAWRTPLPAQPTAPDGTLAALQADRDAFLGRCAEAGAALPSPPEIREWTRPSMMSWRREAHAVAVPRWDELTPEQRALVSRMAGSEALAPEVFRWVFRWFLLPHELAHAIQDGAAVRLPHARSERLANDAAVAFLREQPGGGRRVDRFARIVEEMVARLPDPVPPHDDSEAWFDARYDELPVEQYAAFQVRYFRDSLARRDTLHLPDICRTLVGR
jgi:hypothetical protein